MNKHIHNSKNVWIIYFNKSHTKIEYFQGQETYKNLLNVISHEENVNYKWETTVHPAKGL